jgi:hypothetical protein
VRYLHTYPVMLGRRFGTATLLRRNSASAARGLTSSTSQAPMGHQAGPSAGFSFLEIVCFVGIALFTSETFFRKWQSALNESAVMLTDANAVPLWRGDEYAASCASPPNSGNSPGSGRVSKKGRSVPISALGDDKP